MAFGVLHPVYGYEWQRFIEDTDRIIPSSILQHLECGRYRYHDRVYVVSFFFLNSYLGFGEAIRLSFNINPYFTPAKFDKCIALFNWFLVNPDARCRYYSYNIGTGCITDLNEHLRHDDFVRSNTPDPDNERRDRGERREALICQ